MTSHTLFTMLNKEMSLFKTRFLALTLMLDLSVGQPAFALRPGSGIDDPKGSVRTGLEEALHRANQETPTPVLTGLEEQLSREEYEKLYLRFSAQVQPYKPMNELAATFYRMKPGEFIVVNSFGSLDELKDFLEAVGDAFEVGFPALVRPDEWTGPLDAHYLVRFQQQSRKFGVTAYKTGRRVRLLQEDIEPIFRRWGFVGRRGAIVVLIRGEPYSVSISTEWAHYSVGHSHPASGSTGASEGDARGGDMKFFDSSPAKRQGAVAALSEQEWRHPVSDETIQESNRVYLLERDGSTKIITYGEGLERLFNNEIYMVKTPTGETVAVHVDLQEFKFVLEDGTVSTEYRARYGFERMKSADGSPIAAEIRKDTHGKPEIVFRITKASGGLEESTLLMPTISSNLANQGFVGLDQGRILLDPAKFSLIPTRAFIQSGLEEPQGLTNVVAVVQMKAGSVRSCDRINYTLHSNFHTMG